MLAKHNKTSVKRVRLGLVLLVIGLLLPMVVRPAGQGGRNWLEAARGVAIGMSLVFIIAGATKLGMRRRESQP